MPRNVCTTPLLLWVLAALTLSALPVRAQGPETWQRLSPEERARARRNYERFQQLPEQDRQRLNERYQRKFGFPFILAVKGYDRAGVIAEFARRVERSPDQEFEEALRQIATITGFRLATLLAAA